MIIELINTGSELVLGRVLNTHQQWLCRQLADLGHIVTRQVAVADNARDIVQAVREALERADLVITTGGLGPTSDDLTRDLIAKLLDKPLRENPTVVAHIEKFFSMRKRPIPASTRVQALVPEGALVLANAHGTAPGLAMEITEHGDQSRQPSAILHASSSPPKRWLVMLPGPPRELRPMFSEAVVPILRRVLPSGAEFVCRNLRTTGIGESMVQEKIGALLKRFVATGLEIGYCARVAQVDVRLSARGANAASLVREAESAVRPKLASHLYGEGDEELETVIVHLLKDRKQTLALAESCTGGLLTHRLTNVPGASEVLIAGVVSYANDAKEKLLGVRVETIAAHGAVSNAVAHEMAEGARRKTAADFAVSTTGIAGPTGGTATKPVGTVFIGLATPHETMVQMNFNPYDRETFKQATTNQALDMLWRRIIRC